MSIVHVVSVSGGKDSTAVLLLALERFGRERVRPIFCDTGNEHQDVYDYLDYLESRLNIKIERLRANFDQEIAAKRKFIALDCRRRGVRWTNKSKRKALEVLHPTGNPYLDLCLWKGRFPSRMAQFCTEHLKRNPAVEHQLALIGAGHTVVSWQGIRRDESMNRRNAVKFERVAPGLYHYRPIVDWSAEQTLTFAAERNVVHNPLYTQGMGRVGCMPCINVNKKELREIAQRFPEHIERIRNWEQLVAQASKRGAATFIPAPGIKPREAKDHGILSVVQWAYTTHGGKQLDLLAMEPSNGCKSSYGLCDAGSS